MTHISLSTNQVYDLIGSVYDFIESSTDVDLTNDYYDVVEETIMELVERLNEVE